MKQPTIKHIEITGWIVLSVLVASGALLTSREVVGGFIFGGIISILNFQWLGFFLNRVLNQHNKKAGKLVVAGYFLRYIIVFVVLLIGLRQGWVSPIPLIIGLSVMIVAICLWGLWQVIRQNKMGEFEK